MESENKKRNCDVDLKMIPKREESLDNKENAMVSNTKILASKEISENKVLQEKNMNECSNTKNTAKKQEMHAIVKFDFSPKKVEIL